MAEIKSTLDLVMERTRNMRFSANEKRNQEIEDIRKQFNGFIQKYLDGIIDIETLSNQVAGLRKAHTAATPSDLIAVLFDRIEPETLNGQIPSLLHALFGCEIDKLQQIGLTYRQEIADKAEQRSAQLLADLRTESNISGSAVVANLQVDPLWLKETEALKKRYAARLDEEKARLGGCK